MHLHGNNTKSGRMLIEGFLPVLQQNTQFIATRYQQEYCEMNGDMAISVPKAWPNNAPRTCKDITEVLKETH